MTCIYCGGDTKVIDTCGGTDEIIRRRRCLTCRKTFYTVESDIDNKLGAMIMNQYKKAKCSSSS